MAKHADSESSFAGSSSGPSVAGSNTVPSVDPFTPTAPAPSIAILPASTSELVAAVAEGGGIVEALSDSTAGVVLADVVGPEAVERAVKGRPGIRWVQLPLAGVDQYDDLMRAHRNISWTSGKGAFRQPVGEFALTLTLALMRGIPVFARAGTWGPPQGTSLHNRHVVVVGAGGVGQEILRLLRAFTEHITVVRAHDHPGAGAERTVTDAGLDDVLKTADVVILAAAMTEGTRHLMDARRLARMKDHAFLINVARGPLVDTDALTQALAEGKLAGAALDVTDPQPLPDGHPLWSEPRALITPHTAETPEMVAPLLAGRVRDNVRRLAAGQPLDGLVDVDAGY
ncbi:NAD(P)-dependent oxidoreductase [Arthrobacter sunyaminii]|uniref:Hydroxyacid dehydrogenase n=1 Tax=Arthrobacter sunyaminii TaxID=2816859 RepID=A0A975S6L4_9MICC|nr:NAD(P)-dependent oxidoreductase [Arthrobacter sunyaminii]MBO0909997.1 hydroxyacid dehydrogenase [Arthrobacter sunyaminii]QWQ36775.1 hydroxyacid dehydrogenase [Arthrobacter sunyaminii]